MSVHLIEKAAGLEHLIKNWGKASNTVGNMLPLGNENFVHSIEPGIRPLVLLLVNKYQWITYSSCEGHPSNQSCREVRLVARNLNELKEMYETLQACAEKLRPASAQIKIVVKKYHIENSDQKKYPAVSVVFEKQDTCSCENYFLNLNDATIKYIFLLNLMKKQ